MWDGHLGSIKAVQQQIELEKAITEQRMQLHTAQSQRRETSKKR